MVSKNHAIHGKHINVGANNIVLLFTKINKNGNWKIVSRLLPKVGDS